MIWFEVSGFCYTISAGPSLEPPLGYSTIALRCGDPAALGSVGQVPSRALVDDRCYRFLLRDSETGNRLDGGREDRRERIVNLISLSKCQLLYEEYTHCLFYSSCKPYEWNSTTNPILQLRNYSVGLMTTIPKTSFGAGEMA